MTDAWDDEDFEPEIPDKGDVVADKWAGEDEDDEIKDNWDDEDEEGGDKEKKEGGTAVQVKKKKPIKDRIAEKEAQKKAALEEQKRIAEEMSKKLSPQELMAEKLRRQKQQEEADLKLACDAFGTNDDSNLGTEKIDTFSPVSKEDFETFENLLKKKITQFEGSAYYVGFLENLYRTLAVGLDPEDLKRLGSALNTLANEKTKVQKGTKAKKKKGPKVITGKETDNLDDGTFGGEFDDYI